MPRRRAIPEEMKERIADLYHNGGLSVGAIADTLGVSVRTIYNYKDYSPSKSFESKIDELEYEEPTPVKKNQWQCKKCGYLIDKKMNICPKCHWGPFNSIFVKVESPEYESFVEQEIEEREPKEEIVDSTRDYWVCKECDHISNIEFDVCPECECEEVIFAPDGNEPRNHSEQIESNAETPDIDNETEEEDEYFCADCGTEIREGQKICHGCGKELDWERSD